MENEFLIVYAKDLGWRLRNPEKIMRKLCEEQMYMKVIAAVRHFPNVDFFDVYGLNP